MVNAAVDFDMKNTKLETTVTSPRNAVSVSVITETDAALQKLMDVADGALYTGHQHPNFIRAWLKTGDSDPVFIVLQAKGHGEVLLPLEKAPGAIAQYIGGKHAYGNFPIGKASDIEALADIATDALADCATLQQMGINALALERQYESWQNIANPFINSHSVCSPNVALSFSLEGGFDAVVARSGGSKRRKKFRSQMRKLETVGAIHTVIPVELDDAASTLETFFAFKAERFRTVGIPDAFADDATRAAFMDMFLASMKLDEKVHELYMLKAGDEIAAIMGCTVNNGHLTVEFSTFNPKFAHSGPGEQLFYLAIEQAANRGLSIFDFGVGDERFKRSWCDVETWHKDTFIAVSARGQLTRIAKQMRSTMVRSLKSNKHLWKTAKAARRKLGDLRG